jgi:hypothetical protein
MNPVATQMLLKWAEDSSDELKKLNKNDSTILKKLIKWFRVSFFFFIIKPFF